MEDAIIEQSAETLTSGTWVDIPRFNEVRPLFGGSRIRWMIERAKPHLNAQGQEVPGNGLAPGIAKITTRDDGRFGIVLIDLDFFDAWIEAKRLAPVPAGSVRVRRAPAPAPEPRGAATPRAAPKPKAPPIPKVRRGKGRGKARAAA